MSFLLDYIYYDREDNKLNVYLLDVCEQTLLYVSEIGYAVNYSAAHYLDLELMFQFEKNDAFHSYQKSSKTSTIKSLVTFDSVKYKNSSSSSGRNIP